MVMCSVVLKKELNDVEQLKQLTLLYDFLPCDILTQGLIGLIEYSYHQGIPSFLETHLQKTPGLSVLGPEQFQDR
jgi:hypothetical protein